MSKHFILSIYEVSFEVSLSSVFACSWLLADSWPGFGSKLCCDANSTLIRKPWKHSPNTVLAGTDSLFSQKDTWERITVMIHGKYVWMTKYPIFLLRWKCVVMTTYSPRNVEKDIWVGNFLRKHHIRLTFVFHGCCTDLLYCFVLRSLSWSVRFLIDVLLFSS